jgi:peptidyl-prolyl cis-trans isomerase C
MLVRPHSSTVISLLAPRRGRRLATALLICLGIQSGLFHSPVFAQTPPAATPDDKPAGSLADLAAQFDRTPDTVVADVNGSPITLGTVADRLRDFAPNLATLPASMVYKAALEDVIQQRAMAVKARELGVDKDPATQRRIQSATDHELALAMIRRILPEIVTDQAIQDRYDTTIAGQPGQEEVQLRVVTTASEADGRLVLAALAKGAEFGAVARQSSRDPSSVAGGEIGYASRDRLTPEIGAVAFALSPGQTSLFPILSRGVWFVIQVEGRRQLATPTLAESKPLLTAALTSEASGVILRKSRAAVVVDDFGPTGMGGKGDGAATKSH